MRKIKSVNQKKNAIILAHYYAPSEIQEVADYVGDSFYLAKIAKNSDADVIVFCGVGFMGESAKILNPNKKVLMPDVSADCPMAHMVKAGKIEEMRTKYDDLAVVCYINSNITRQITLDDISTNVFLSKSTLSHLFKSKMNISIKQYILQKKMVYASEQIANDIPANEAAKIIGYDNYSNFFTIYKKIMEKAPSEHKNQIAKRTN